MIFNTGFLLLTFSVCVTEMEKKFSPYFDAVKPVILEALHNTQHSQNCQAAVGTLSDLLLALQDRIKPYVQEFLGLLMEVVAVSRLLLFVICCLGGGEWIMYSVCPLF